MAKLRFRLRISSCRSKDSVTTAASNPSSHTAASCNLSSFHHQLRRHPPVVSSHSGNCCPRGLHHRHLRPVYSSGADADAEADDLPLTRGIRASYLWSRSEKWHIISCASSENSSSSSPPRSKIDSKLLAGRNSRCTRESDSSGDDSGWFSTDEEYEYEDDENYARCSKEVDAEESSCFAVSKVSADPRRDFRQSMAEMVVERGIYDVEGLRRLLHCFLSLNERHHREAILAAFADVWYAIFPSVALAPIFPNIFYSCRT